MRVYETGMTQVEIKKDDSPLTRADRESNSIICSRLEDLPVHYPIFSEESNILPYDERRPYQTCWLVDPLDGTKEFISRNGEFTVNIALIEDGNPILGVIYVPLTRELYYATKGEGAFWEKDGSSGAMHVTEFSMQDNGLKVVCSRSHLDPDTRAFIDRLHHPECVSRGSALKFIMIAAGEAQLYPRLAPTMEWDIAAGQCIVEEAGGFVVDFHTGIPLRYNKESLLNPSFLAGGRIA